MRSEGEGDLQRSIDPLAELWTGNKGEGREREKGTEEVRSGKGKGEEGTEGEGREETAANLKLATGGQRARNATELIRSDRIRPT